MSGLTMVILLLTLSQLDIGEVEANGAKSTVEIPFNQKFPKYSPFSAINATQYNKLPDSKHGKDEVLKTYIVHVPARYKPSSFQSHENWHLSMIASASATVKTLLQYKDSEDTRVSSIDNRLLYSYNHAMEGFAAAMTREEVEALGRMSEVMMIEEDKIYQLQTTRTPQFLQLFTTPGKVPIGPLFKSAKGGSDVIIGLIDSGIWPEHQSFQDDSGYSSIPARWKGTCDNVDTFQGKILCNRKLIGARVFYKGLESVIWQRGMSNFDYKRSPRDYTGHGSHCASIAAGSIVANASYMGYAVGSAAGMAPNARLAIYKTCWNMIGCVGSDNLAAFEAAIADGVDVLSLSFGTRNKDYHYMQGVNLGTFRAATKGIVSIAAAGNYGPELFSLANTAPWIITVASSTLDRDCPATFTLGPRLPSDNHGNTHTGLLIYTGDVSNSTQKEFPLVDGGKCDVPNPISTYGAIVLCWDDNDGMAQSAERRATALQIAGASGILYVVGRDDMMVNYPNRGNFWIPMVLINKKAATDVRRYISSEQLPTVKLDLKQGNTRVGFQESPSIASSSSRGPNMQSWELMKPDVAAPGVRILAARSRGSEFMFRSGTSMATPHVAGIVALLRAARPMWSPAMIQSALITTARHVNNRGNHIVDLSSGQPASPTAMGAGEVNPNRALDPGLVYNSTPQDYVDFLCSLGYKSNNINALADINLQCSSPIPPRGHLNYPSFSVIYLKSQAQAKAPPSFIFSRTLTNVRPLKSNYTLSVFPPPYVHIDVSPDILSFEFLNQELSYTIKFTPDPSAFRNMTTRGQISSGSIVWEDGDVGTGHQVRSPIMFTWYDDVAP